MAAEVIIFGQSLNSHSLRGLTHSAMSWKIHTINLMEIFFSICLSCLIWFYSSGARGDHEKCDVSNTSSEACSKEAVGLYRGGNAKLSKSLWLSRKSSQEMIQIFELVYWGNKVLTLQSPLIRVLHSHFVRALLFLNVVEERKEFLFLISPH